MFDLHGAFLAGKAVIEIRGLAVGQGQPHFLPQKTVGKRPHHIPAGPGPVTGNGPLFIVRQQDQAHGRVYPVQLDGLVQPGAVLAYVQKDQVEPPPPAVFLQQGMTGLKTDELQPAVLFQRGKPLQHLQILLPVTAAQCDITDHRPTKPPAWGKGTANPAGGV